MEMKHACMCHWCAEELAKEQAVVEDDRGVKPAFLVAGGLVGVAVLGAAWLVWKHTR